MSNVLTLNGIPVIGHPTGLYMATSGVDFGTVTPDLTFISSIYLDGDIASGKRTVNKTWDFSVAVIIPQTSFGMDLDVGRAALSAAVDALLSALYVDSFLVTWTPSGCATSQVMTRGRPTVGAPKVLLANDALTATVSVTFETGPFLQSAALQTITVAPSGGPSSVQLDGMNSGVFTNGVLSTTTKYEGAGSCAFSMTRQTDASGNFYYTSLPVGRTISSTDLSGDSASSVRVQMGASRRSIAVTATMQLTSSGIVYTPPPLNFAVEPNSTLFGLLAFDLTSIAANLTAVTEYSVTFASSLAVNAPPGFFTGFLDDLRAYPPGSVGNSTATGAVLVLPAVIGSARTPVALAVARAGTPATSGNVLPAADSSFETGSVGDWGFTGNCSLAVAATGFKATHSLQLTATANGNMSAFCPVGATQLPVNPNTTYTLIASSHGNTAGRAFTLSVFWNDINGVSIPGSAQNVSGTDTTSGFTTITANVTSPAGAVSANIAIAYTACTAAEVHLLDGVGLIVGGSQSWVIGTGSTVTVPLNFTDLLLHAPPGDQDPDLAIYDHLSPVGGGYQVTVPAANMNYDGTYTVVVLLSASGTSAGTITATFTQEINGSSIAVDSVAVAVTGSQSILSIDNIELPVTLIPPEAAGGSLIIAITSTRGSDAFSDVALCDTRGQVLIATGLPSTNDGIWIDQPDPLVGMGNVYQSATNRTGAYSAMGDLDAYTGPVQFDPGNNRLLAASTAGAPTVEITYPPSWLDEAQV